MTTHVVAELGGERAGLAVREAEEDDVVAGEGLGVGRLEHPVGQRHQVRLEGAEGLAGVGAAGQRADLDLGMAEQQAQHLAAGVPTGSGDGDPLPRHVHDYTDAPYVHVQRVSRPEIPVRPSVGAH